MSYTIDDHLREKVFNALRRLLVPEAYDRGILARWLLEILKEGDYAHARKDVREDAASEGLEGSAGTSVQERSARPPLDPRNPHDTGLEGHGRHDERASERLARKTDWSRDWREVARELCWENETQPGVYGMAHGTAPQVYGPRKLSEAQHRKERLKACGNGIIGQIAVEIMRAIKYADEHEKPVINESDKESYYAWFR